jgi:hypothetical protein
VSYPNRLVTYVSDDQLAAIRACLAREPYYGSISRMVCRLIGDALAARGSNRAARPRATARRSVRFANFPSRTTVMSPAVSSSFTWCEMSDKRASARPGRCGAYLLYSSGLSMPAALTHFFTRD